MKKLFASAAVKQFLSYFCVGGVAAIVEWGMFAFFANGVGIDWLWATSLAFIFSTAVNWLLGKLRTFKDNTRYRNRRLKEIFLIFFVSAIGLLCNIVLMYVFVTLMGLDTTRLKMLSKVMATGIVFMWNYLIRIHCLSIEMRSNVIDR